MEIKKTVNKVKLLSNSQKEKVKSEYAKCLPKGFNVNYFEDGYEYIDGKVYYYFSYGRSRGYFKVK